MTTDKEECQTVNTQKDDNSMIASGQGQGQGLEPQGQGQELGFSP